MMSLSIQYISKDNEIEKVESKEHVPEHATFIWYDYDSFDDKEKLKSNHDFDDDRCEDATTNNYRTTYYKNHDDQIFSLQDIDQELFEAHAVNVCVMQDVNITQHNYDLRQFVDIEIIIKYKCVDLEIE